MTGRRGVGGAAKIDHGINATHTTTATGHGFVVQRKLLGLKTQSKVYFSYPAGTDPYAMYPVGTKIMGKSITGATDVVFTVTGFLEAKTKPAAADAPAAGAGEGSSR